MVRRAWGVGSHGLPQDDLQRHSLDFRNMLVLSLQLRNFNTGGRPLQASVHGQPLHADVRDHHTSHQRRRVHRRTI